ncbi:acid phosphatase, partial [Mesorhizobium sp. M4B.F.Ca.ET.172.01.1.1]
MIRSFLSLCLASTALAALTAAAHAAPAGYDKIDTVVVIFAENRSFDNLYGGFPGANGLANVSPEQARQLDRDGKPLSELPPAWGGLTGKGV